MSDTWLSQALAAAQPLQSSPIEVKLIGKLLDAIDNQDYSTGDQSIALATAFDLLVAAEYYSAIAHIGWLYCPLQSHCCSIPIQAPALVAY